MLMLSKKEFESINVDSFCCHTLVVLVDVSVGTIICYNKISIWPNTENYLVYVKADFTGYSIGPTLK